jgi:glucosamine 6-phosphate synthetase-like amidotransferase/phosphosugar isomerase protein
MCSVFGSFSKNMYDVLMVANADRGNFAYSHCIYGKNNTPFHISKFEKIPAPDQVKDLDTNIFYCGHYQAPTSSARKWKPETSHPFEFGDWIVAHNGVITNVEELQQKYAPSSEIIVDSNIIPMLLTHFETDASDAYMPNEVAVKLALEKICGTFALWIINKKTKRCFVARQGSTLFLNNKTGSFSSVECKSANWMQAIEGYIYEIDLKKKSIATVAKIESNNSPFMFIPG